MHTLRDMAVCRFIFHFQGLLLASSLLASCTNVSINARWTSERTNQVTDAFSSSGNIAKTAIRATAVAAISQPVTTLKLGLVNLWQRPRELVAGNLHASFRSELMLPDVPGTWQFEKLLDRMHFPRAESGTVKWLVDGSGFFQEMDRQVAASNQSIDLQVFIFDNDDIGVRCADLLKRRAADVPVHVLFDALGSTFAWTAAPETAGPRDFVPPSDMEEYLEDHSKVRVRRTLNPWLACDHTKLLVFDQRAAILGGMNIGREYFSEWHDLMVRVEGPVVASLSREFKRAWRKAGWSGDFALFREPSIFRRPKPVTEGIPLRVLRTDPSEGRYEILDAMLLAIRGARKRIWIENPYFGHDEIAAACESAARRGVDVRIIIPAAGDSGIMDAGNFATANGLIRAGAKVFRYPRMTHMKVMICDDWASVGSANLDTLSMRINRELNLAFSHADEVRKLADTVLAPDFQKSRRLRLSETKSATAGIAEAIADQL
jgi:cardiolipin synthase